MCPPKPPKSPDSPFFSTEDDRAWEAEKRQARSLQTPKKPETRFKPHPFQTTQPPTPPSWQPRATPLNILSHTAERLAGKSSAMPASFLKELALGTYPPSGWLDLHGHHEGDAWLKLMNWLATAYAQEHRCVLVVCGKGRGYGPYANMGLIKYQLPFWLASHPYVEAFHSAIPKDGGQGAVYVYLKRRR